MIRRLAVRLLLISVSLAGFGSVGFGQIVFSNEARSGVDRNAVSSVEYVEPMGEMVIESNPWSDESISSLPGEPMGCCEDGCANCLPARRLFVDGWLQQGFTWNPESPTNRFNTPVTFNDRSNEYQVNQLYISMGRSVVPDAIFWDIGGQVDLLYGTDYFFTTALGLETELNGTQRWNGDSGPRGAATYGLAMPQLYAEVYAPIGYGVTVKMGHFYSPLGYETVAAPYNFFYSHSYQMQYAEPRTFTGLLAYFHLGPRLSASAGFTRGWDTWEDPNGQESFLGGIEWTSWNDRSKLAFAITTGKEDPAGQNERTAYSLVFTHHITPCFTYVLQHDYGTEENAAIDENFQLQRARWYGITNYFFLALQNNRSIGVRAEWFRDQENARVLGIPIAADVDGGNYVEIALGMNCKPRPYITFRPEVRWDWSDVEAPNLGLQGMFNDFLNQDQITVAADLIIVF